MITSRRWKGGSSKRSRRSSGSKRDSSGESASPVKDFTSNQKIIRLNIPILEGNKVKVEYRDRTKLITRTGHFRHMAYFQAGGGTDIDTYYARRAIRQVGNHMTAGLFTLLGGHDCGRHLPGVLSDSPTINGDCGLLYQNPGVTLQLQGSVAESVSAGALGTVRQIQISGPLTQETSQQQVVSVESDEVVWLLGDGKILHTAPCREYSQDIEPELEAVVYKVIYVSSPKGIGGYRDYYVIAAGGRLLYDSSGSVLGAASRLSCEVCSGNDSKWVRSACPCVQGYSDEVARVYIGRIGYEKGAYLLPLQYHSQVTERPTTTSTSVVGKSLKKLRRELALKGETFVLNGDAKARILSRLTRETNFTRDLASRCLQAMTAGHRLTVYRSRSGSMAMTDMPRIVCDAWGRLKTIMSARSGRMVTVWSVELWRVPLTLRCYYYARKFSWGQICSTAATKSETNSAEATDSCQP